MTTNDSTMLLDPLSLDLSLASFSAGSPSNENVCWDPCCGGICACDCRIPCVYPSTPVDGGNLTPHHAALDDPAGVESLHEVLHRIQWIDNQLHDLPHRFDVAGNEDEEEQLLHLEELRGTMKPPLRETEGPWHWGYTHIELTTLREAYARQQARNRSPFEPLIPSHLNPKRECVPPLSWMFFKSPCSGVRNWTFHRPLHVLHARRRSECDMHMAKRDLEFKQCIHCRREGSTLHNSLVSRRYKMIHQQLLYSPPLLSGPYGRPPGLPLTTPVHVSPTAQEPYGPYVWELSESEVKHPTTPRLVDCRDFEEESDSDDPILIDDWDSDSDSSSEGDIDEEYPPCMPDAED